MPGRSPSMSKTQRQQYVFEVLHVLDESPVALNIEEISAHSLVLAGFSTQRMARFLSELVNMGLVRKSYNREQKRMTYMAVSQLETQGYRLDLE